MAPSCSNDPREKRPPRPSETEVDSPGTSGPDGQGGDRPREIGGRDGPEPTRFGDWEKNGRCIDF